MLQFIDSARFMASLLSNLVDNSSEGVHRTKQNLEHDDKKCKIYRIKYTYCNRFLEYSKFKDDLTERKYLCCNKSYENKINEKLKEQTFNMHKVSNRNNKKFILLLRTGLILMKTRMIVKNSIKDYYLK